MPKEKTLVVHRDYFDRELAVEDFVVFSVRNLFQVGRIISVTPKRSEEHTSELQSH